MNRRPSLDPWPIRSRPAKHPPLSFPTSPDGKTMQEAVHFANQRRVQDFILRICMYQEIDAPLAVAGVNEGSLANFLQPHVLAKSSRHALRSPESSARCAHDFLAV